jgi:D-beta-D-heptose 7-phosphate kinase / D-beta-D-heptose 1-phosphate adenosyltransferase
MNLLDPQPEAELPPAHLAPAGLALADPAPDMLVADQGAPDMPTVDQVAPDLVVPDLVAAVRLLSHASVLVVGDVMLDRFIYGHVTRISPEAPVPILSVEREVGYPGGAANVVRNLTALGAAVALVSVVGDDQAGSDLTGLVGGQPGVEPWLLVQGGRTTTMKTRLVAGGQHLLRTDREVTTPIHPKLAERMISIATDAMAATGVTVLSDYRKGLLADDVAARLIAAAHQAGRKVIVDPTGPDCTRYAGADIIIPNVRDLAEDAMAGPEDEASVIAAAQALRARYNIGAVLVTKGAAGMTLVDATIVRHFPAEAAEVYDVSGAGDTVTAVIAAGIATKLDLALAVRLASIAAGVVVGKVGTAVARTADLLAALSPEGGTLRKVVSRQAALEQVARWRHRGDRIGFTNGCFDMMHPGHVSLLDAARDACERLVVGLNDDASTRRLKGPTRPVQPEAVRAAMLAGLPSVDLVTAFAEDTPAALIEALRPDVLVKGADYSLDSVVGADQVRSWGGRVLLADLLPGQTSGGNTERARG